MDSRDKKFVVQKHTRGGDVHWDFMLEAGEFLETYRVDKSPGELLVGRAKAERIFDHSLKFLTYQGAVNNGEGTVEIADSGIYEITSRGESEIELKLVGGVLDGIFKMRHIEGDFWQVSVVS